MSDPGRMTTYNQAVIAWKESVDEYEAALLDAAEATAQHKAARAKAIVTLRASDPKVSHALAESVGDADPEVERLSLLRLVKEAEVEGIKQRLAWHRAQADNLRTQVVDERASNAFMSQAGAGPGRTTFEPTAEPPSRREPPRGPYEPEQPRQAPPRRPEPDLHRY